MTVKRTGRPEESARYYDRIYALAAKNGGYNTARYHDIYNVVMDYLSQSSHANIRVLECGCGTGALAERIIAAGYFYRGFDFSDGALAACSDSVRGHVWKATAYAEETWRQFAFDTVIALEVFEHLDDHRVLRLIPKDTRVIFSVPDFDSQSHVRVYPDIDSIVEYYKDELMVCEVDRIQTQDDKAITVCGAIKL